MNQPQRKQNRLRNYDYSLPGAYFITICTHERENLFWETVGASIARPQKVNLSACGQVVDSAIKEIPKHYAAVSLDHYVVMPNHVHLLLQINALESGRAMHAPTISTVVQQLKGAVTKQIGHSVWQKLFYDHIVRGDKDYAMIWEYIENNPAKWMDDCFYRE